MTTGPREAAHREHKDALEAQLLAMRQFGRFSETFKRSNVRTRDSLPPLSIFPSRRQNWNDPVKRNAPEVG